MIWLSSIFLVTLLMGMPIVFVLGLSAAGYFFFTGQTHLMIVLPQRMIAGMDQFVLLAIPLFVMAGNVMASGSLTTRLVGFANTIVGRFRGGLSLTAVWGGFMFGGVSGSAAADAAALGTVLVPDMKAQGYDVDYSAGLIATASLMAPLVPPSIAMIIYGALSSTSIGQLFVAGLVPGILLAVLLSIYAIWVARRKGYPVARASSFVEVLREAAAATPVLMLPVIIIVGIRGGVFTPTEAAAVAAFYSMLVAAFVLRTLTWSRFCDALIKTILITSAIYFMVGVAYVLSYIFAIEDLPERSVSFLTGLTDNKYLILLFVTLILLFLGMFLDTIGTLVLTVPSLMLIGQQLEMDPVHLGVIVVFNIVIGFVTPPVGLCLFVMAAVTGRPMERIAVAALPGIGISIGLLTVLTLFPGLVLFVPRLLGG